MTRTERYAIGAIALVTVLAGIARYASGIPPSGIRAGDAGARGTRVAGVVLDRAGGRRLGPGATRLLQSTVGNLPEFFVVLFALNAGQLIVAETAILGSILANALLVLGLVIVGGAPRAPDGVMRFSTRLPNDTATLLLLSTFIIILVALADSSHDAASHHVKTISIVGAVAMLAVYAVWVRQYLTSDQKPIEGSGPPRRRWSPRWSCSPVAGAASAFVSDWFVHALQPTIHHAPYLAGVRGARDRRDRGQRRRERDRDRARHKGKIGPRDLGRQELGRADRGVPVPGARAGVAADDHDLTFALSPIYVGALFGTALIIWQITATARRRGSRARRWWPRT